MKQIETPLFDALENFHKKNKVSYHVPGHKNGQVFLDKGKQLYTPLLHIDATEISGLDDLHAPVGPIREAQWLLAELYGTNKSYFLVNGTTSGNLAMILSVCGEGNTVLVSRHSHKSILHGLMLANANPVFITPNFYEDWGVAGGNSTETISEALQHYPDTKAIILTYPNYYGITEDLTEIIALAHKKKIPVLVDEAHGAHFTLGSPFPKSSLEMGADLVVHSAHKTLPAMTMGSYLHVNGNLVDHEKIEFYLQMLQSSSPSYPIMGSLDLARAYLASFSKNDVQYLVNEINQFKDQLSSMSEIEVLIVPKGKICDPLKVTIRSTNGFSGYELQEILEEQGIYTELADPNNVLFVLPLLKEGEDFSFEKIIEIIRDALRGKVGQQKSKSIFYDLDQEKMSTLSMSYSSLKKVKTKQVPIDEAKGLISGEMVIPYPPGIPLMMVGGKITKEKIEALKNYISLKSRFHGGTFLSDGKLIVFEKDRLTD